MSDPKMIRKMNILMVEDNALDAFMTKRFLGKTGGQYNLTHITDGAAALDFLKRSSLPRNPFKPDLILLDLNLPHVNGTEILKVLKIDPQLQNIPVIVITGETLDADFEERYDLHEHAATIKWVGMKDFMTLVKAIEDVYNDMRKAAFDSWSVNRR